MKKLSYDFEELTSDFKGKEILHKEEIIKYEKELYSIKGNEGERFEKEYENHLKSKTKLKEYESN
jgi:hypothetical protein